MYKSNVLLKKIGTGYGTPIKRKLIDIKTYNSINFRHHNITAKELCYQCYVTYLK